jgi:hypothetical protein
MQYLNYLLEVKLWDVLVEVKVVTAALDVNG